MRTRLASVAVFAGLLLGALPAWPHHAFGAEFDAKRPVKLRGVVTKMEWINPHAWMHIDVKDTDGKVTSWMIEAGTPNTLFRRGFTKDSLKIGTEVFVDGYQAKDGSTPPTAATSRCPTGGSYSLARPGPALRTKTSANGRH